MPYRDETLPDGTKVRTRISREELLDWYYHGRHEGHATRPPDISNDSVRAWLVRSPNPNVKANLGAIVNVDIDKGDFLIGSFVADVPVLGAVKFFIHWSGDNKKYTATVSVLDSDQDWIKSYDDPDEIFSDIDGLAQHLGMIPGVEWLVTTPLDVKNIEEECEIAQEEFDQEPFDSNTPIN